MKKPKLKNEFKKLVLEIENSKNNPEENEFLEQLRKLTGYKTVDNMIKRFKKLSGIEKK